MLLLFSLLITLFTAFQINRFLKYERFFDWLTGYVLINFSLLVFVLTLAGLFYQMNSLLVILLMQLVLLGGSWLLSRWLKKYQYPVPKAVPLRKIFKGVPIVITIFAGVMTLVVLLHLVYVLFVPPNNNDSLMWHLSRVAMWHQTGSWLPWNTPVTWQLTFPFNGEMVAYWTVLFLKRDTLIAIFPWISGIFTSLMIYHLSEQLFKKRDLSIFVAALWLSFPIVQLNLSSSRHDHPGTFLLMAAFYFFFQAVRSKEKSHWLMTGLPLALSVGTSMGVATYLPSFAILFLITWLVLKKITFKDILQLSVMTTLSFLLLSSPIFISNMIHFKTPLGPGATHMTSQSDAVESGPIEHFLLMNGRWGYQLFDCHGFPIKVSNKCHLIKSNMATWFSNRTGMSLETERSLFNQYIFTYEEFYPLTEDSNWYSLTGTLVSVTVGLYAMITAIRKRDFFFIALSCFIIVVPPTMATLWAGWKPWDGRYYMLLVALYCVGAVGLLEIIKPKLRQVILLFFVVIAFVNVYITIEQNPGRTIIGERAFWRQSRIEHLSTQAKFIRTPLKMVDQYVPEVAVLAIDDLAINFRYEYGYFGERFSRTIVFIHPSGVYCDPEWLVQNEVEYLLLGTTEEHGPDCLPDGFSYLESRDRWILYRKD